MSLEAMIPDMKEYGVYDHYCRIVSKLPKVIMGMNRKGMLLDITKREEAIADFTIKIEALEVLVETMLGGQKVNLRGQEIKDIFYIEMRLYNGRRTGSLDKDALTSLASRYPDLSLLFNTIKECKHLLHTRSSFLEALQPGEDMVMYPRYKIGPVTGRLSCKRPNFQNIPPGVPRSLFVARPGYVFIYADYSQLEVRILALLANEKSMLDILESGGDFHEYTRSIIYEGQEKTSEQRKISKNIFFGIVSYGGTVHGIKEKMEAELSTVPEYVLEGLVDKYFKAHPNLMSFRTKIQEQVEKYGMVRTPFGRIRFFFGDKKDIIRQGYNTPVQGSAADIKNIKMIEVDETILSNHLVLDVHDSLMWEVPEKDSVWLGKAIKECLEGPFKEFGGYRFPVKIKMGHSWEEASS